MSELPDIPEDDPTRDIWLRLLRKVPGKGNGRQRTAAERRATSRRLREHYADTPHPRKGRQVVAPPSDAPVLGTCSYCGDALTNADQAELGIGAQCLRVGVQNGDIRLKKDGTYSIRRTKR
jgi:hypothetical protein